MIGRYVLAAFAVSAAAAACWWLASNGAPAGSPSVPPRTASSALPIAVVVNVADPQSVAVGEYYRRARRIPNDRVIRVRFTADVPEISAEEFARIEAEVERRTPGSVQAYALTWLTPYRVECLSITTAFAFGFDRSFCSTGCEPTRWNPYFDSDSREPMLDFAIRPAMSIAAISAQRARELVDRGIASDGTHPAGTAYLVSTSDAARNVRASRYALAQAMFGSDLAIERIDADAIENRPDVLFYYTGVMKVDALTTNRFLPGAVGDHLTSTGGDLTRTSQMSSLRWLEAGATGSYGTVVEPCNFPGKFPDPVVFMKHYLAGDTLVEAYWKSVAMPGQGIFVGEPLARPFGGTRSP